jgi:protein-disulfide isomerase
MSIIRLWFYAKIPTTYLKNIMKNKSIFIPIFILFTLVLTSCGKAIDTKPMSLGDANAPVIIEEFSDVQCPACGQISPQVEALARNNPDIVRLDFYHFPLPYHEFAFIGAEAAECAGDQGKSWEYLAAEYANQKSLSNDFFMTLAENLKLNTDTFKVCMDDHLKKDKIQQHVLLGKERGIPGTPTLFINGQMIQWGGADQMDAYVKSLAK